MFPGVSWESNQTHMYLFVFVSVVFSSKICTFPDLTLLPEAEDQIWDSLDFRKARQHARTHTALSESGTLKAVGEASTRPSFDKSLSVSHTLFSAIIHYPSLPLSSPPLFSDLALLPSPFIADMSAAFFSSPRRTDTQHELFPWSCPVWRDRKERFRTAEPLHISIPQLETCPLKAYF